MVLAAMIRPATSIPISACRLATVSNASQLNVTRIGNDAYLHSANAGSSRVPESGVKLANWYAGRNTLEHIQTGDGQIYNLPATGDAFAMFG
jgi:hypothetical protein